MTSLPFSAYALIGLVLLVTGIVGIVSALRAATEADDVAATPIASLGRLGTGLVAVQGQAHSENRSVAPLSGKTCIYWRATLFVRTRNGRDEVAQEVFPDRDFALRLDDDSGGVAVLASRADLKLNSEERSDWQCDKETLGPSGVAWVAKQGYSWHSGWSLALPLIISEERIEDGALAYVLGTAAPLGALPPEEQPSGLSPSDAVIWKGNPKRDFIISDQPKIQLQRSIAADFRLGLGGGLLFVLIGAAIIWASYGR